MSRPTSASIARGASVAVLAALVTAACDEPIARGWLLDRTRVLGARVEAEADPSRASLAPGERASITWLVADPVSTPALSWTFAACAPPPGATAAPACEGELLASGAGASTGELVRMELVTPSAPGEELLVLAAFCAGGRATLDARRFTGACEGGATPLVASTSVRLAAAGSNATANMNPTIEAGAIALGEAPWPNASTSPCEGAGPRVAPGARLDVVLLFDDRAREATPDGREALVLSHFVSAGELDRQYTALDPAEPAPKREVVAWTAPPAADVPASGRVVRFTFVLRDGRGGTDFAQRAVCVRAQ